VDIEFSTLEQSFKDFRLSTIVRLESIENAVQDAIMSMQKKFQAFFEDYTLKSNVEEKFNMVADWIEAIQVSHERHMDYANDLNRLYSGKLDSEMGKLREELTPKADPHEPLRKEVQEMLNTMSIDFQGLIREIAILKKTTAYSEKKFENIYTLIDRLKEGKIEPSR